MGSGLGYEAAEKTSSKPGIHPGNMKLSEHPWIFYVKIR
jgi:hypothetical protein